MYLKISELIVDDVNPSLFVAVPFMFPAMQNVVQTVSCTTVFKGVQKSYSALNLYLVPVLYGDNKNPFGFTLEKKNSPYFLLISLICFD